MFDTNFVGFKSLRINLNNLIQLSTLPISLAILGNYDTETNQWVLTPKQLNLVSQFYQAVQN